jgi:hypothetical protein
VPLRREGRWQEEATVEVAAVDSEQVDLLLRVRAAYVTVG